MMETPARASRLDYDGAADGDNPKMEHVRSPRSVLDPTGLVSDAGLFSNKEEDEAAAAVDPYYACYMIWHNKGLLKWRPSATATAAGHVDDSAASAAETMRDVPYCDDLTKTSKATTTTTTTSSGGDDYAAYYAAWYQKGLLTWRPDGYTGPAPIARPVVTPDNTNARAASVSSPATTSEGVSARKDWLKSAFTDKTGHAGTPMPSPNKNVRKWKRPGTASSTTKTTTTVASVVEVEVAGPTATSTGKVVEKEGDDMAAANSKSARVIQAQVRGYVARKQHAKEATPTTTTQTSVPFDESDDEQAEMLA